MTMKSKSLEIIANNENFSDEMKMKLAKKSIGCFVMIDMLF